MHRRFILKLLCASGLMTGFSAIAGRNAAAATPAHKSSNSMAALVDTLVPADEYSPSGSALGVDREMLDEIRRSTTLRSLHADGMRWIEQAAFDAFGRQFGQLDEEARIRIVESAERSAPETVQHRFFVYARDAAMAMYYAKPESWRALGELHPPQPLGYPTYHRKPAE